MDLFGDRKRIQLVMLLDVETFKTYIANSANEKISSLDGGNVDYL